jgi:tyrosyl-tRNA synthetase
VRKAIQNNAISVNKLKVDSHEHFITSTYFLHGKYMMVENGKKNKYMFVIE